MTNKIKVAVNSIRLEENSDTPIMILSDPISNKVLPIWIGTIEAVSIAYAQEGVLHERPQTHDLIIDVIESLNAVLKEVSITSIIDKTYYADLILTTGHLEPRSSYAAIASHSPSVIVMYLPPSLKRCIPNRPALLFLPCQEKPLEETNLTFCATSPSLSW